MAPQRQAPHICNHKHDTEHCQDYADACERCAEECNKMVHEMAY